MVNISSDNLYLYITVDDMPYSGGSPNIELKSDIISVTCNDTIITIQTISTTYNIPYIDILTPASTHIINTTGLIYTMVFGSGTTPINGDMLPDMSATKKGGVPPTGGETSKFLKSNATWEDVPTPPTPLHESLPDLEGGGSHHYHSDQPINTTNSPVFNTTYNSFTNSAITYNIDGTINTITVVGLSGNKVSTMTYADGLVTQIVTTYNGRTETITITRNPDGTIASTTKVIT